MFQTNFSFRRAAGSPDDVCARLAELGYTHAPIADYQNTFAFVKWTEAAKKNGLNPIYGIRLDVTEIIQAKKPALDTFVFYATDDIKPLNDLVRLAYNQGRSLPRIGFTPLIKYSDLKDFPSLVKISGYKARLDVMDATDENLFVGLQPACAKGFVNKAIASGFKFFALQDARYVLPEDLDFYQITCGYDSDLRTWNQSIQTDEDWMIDLSLQGHQDRADIITASLINRNFEFEACTASLKKADLLHPTVDKSLEEMCRDGITQRHIEWTQVYEDRLREELTVIHDKNFQDYFFVVADLMQWSKKNMLVGPGRGSSAGSLVCYLLGITQVDPIEHGLLFFRFLSPDRPDWPDIDGDFSNRDAAIDYLVNRYGVERVAKLGTTGSFMAKNSTNDVAKQLRLPRFEFDKFLDSLPDYAANDKRQEKKLGVGLAETSLGQNLLKKYPAFELAGRLSGNPSNASSHASGVILTNDPLSNYVAVNMETNTTMCDMVDAEKLNLLKLDVLGLITLEIIEEALRLAKLDRHFLDTLSFDDQTAFDVINRQAFFGVFQFDKTVAGLSKEMTVDHFSDIAALLSLGRPGPLSSGASSKWLKKRMGVIPVEYPHELLKPYLQETFGELVYQEQAMLIAREVAGMDWPSVSKLRKAIGKSQGDEALAEYKEPFVSGLEKAGLTHDQAEAFWQELKGFGSYGFNKSHALCYAVITYWTCWLKAHYPLEFTAASLTSTKSKEKQIEFLREISSEGVGYVPFDIDLSTDVWNVGTKDGKKVLVAPLQNVKGLGPTKVQQILGARARGEPLPESLQKMLAKAHTDVDDLYPIRSAIQSLDWKSAVNGKVTRLDQVKSGEEGEWLNYTIIALVSEVVDVDENDPKKQEDRKARGQEMVMQGLARAWGIRLDSDETKGFYAKVTAKKYEDFKDLVLTLVPGRSIVAIELSMVPNGVPCGIVKRLTVVGEMK
jgi:DNA-directed DNA polymerase III PolC